MFTKDVLHVKGFQWSLDLQHSGATATSHTTGILGADLDYDDA